jgi:hypothetical protein
MGARREGRVHRRRLRRAGVFLASMMALGATVGFAGTAGAETNPNASDEACIGGQLSHLAEYEPTPDGTGVLGRRSDFYRAAALDPEFWDQYGVDPGDFGNDPNYSASSVAHEQLMNEDFLRTFSGC